MLEETVKDTLRRLGGRESLGQCPVCGRQVSGRERAVRAWPGKYTHLRCAFYGRGRTAP